MSGTLCPLGTMGEKYPMSFTDYEEPNFWREKYLKFQTDFYNREYPDVQDALVFEREPEKDYLKLRNKVINEHLEIDNIEVALVDSTGQGIDWSIEAEALKQLKAEEENIPTLFSFNGND